MKHFIEIEHTNGLPIKEACTNLMNQLSSFVHESGLFEEPGSCHGLKLVVNPDFTYYSNVNEIGKNIYLTFHNNDIIVNANALNNFKLRCIHLDIKNVKGIDNVLIIIMPSTQDLSQDTSNAQDGEKITTFEAVVPKYSLDKVVMNATTKEQIDRAIILVRQRDLIFEKWGYKEIDPNTKTIVCFYGAPGTGKTMCAHAIAKELDKKIMIASYASIESKWVGEGPKNLRSIFANAYEQDAILFFDEADSFLSKRVNNAETGSDKHYNRMSNEMFQLLEEYNGIVIFATNLVSDFDKAFKSRILAFIEFEIPDKNTRIEMIGKMIPSKLPLSNTLSGQQFEKLAELSEGFSGREIRKSILTSLSSAALKNQDKVSFCNFVDGFEAVRKETVSIEESIQNTNNNDIIKEYIKESVTNNSILNICLYIIWQSENGIEDKIKLELYKFCRYMNLEMPDLSLSHMGADIQNDIKTVINDQRNNDCARICCDFMAKISLDTNRKIAILTSILKELEVKTDNYIQYYNSINQLNI